MTLPPISAADLAATPFARVVPGGDLADVAARFRRARVAPDTVLFRRGDPGDALFVVLSGRVRAEITSADGTQVLGYAGPGELVGETALLRGTPRLADVIACDDAEVAELRKADWVVVAGAHPGLDAAVGRAAEWRERVSETRRIRPDAAWCQAWLARTSLLADVAPEGVAALERRLGWQTLTGGEKLVGEGEAGDCMWLVVRGRLVVTKQHTDGSSRVVGEIEAGECVGELALLTAAPRSATVMAAHDAELLCIDRGAFEAVTRDHPSVALALARTVARRMHGTVQAHPRPPREQTITLVPRDAGVPIATVARMLGAAIGECANVVVLDGPDARDARTEAVSPDVVLLVATSTADDGWTARCLRQADDVVVVAMANGVPGTARVEGAAMEAARRRGAAVHLLLIHDDGAAPSGTATWLAARPGARAFHVRLGQQSDLRRCGRLLSRRALGLALSGGGARGFAHIGVLEALRQAGIAVDVVTGTSMGAQIGALHALGRLPADIHDGCRAWTRARPWGDYTLPFASIVRGRRLKEAIHRLIGPAHIEDLWMPFACTTSNLTRATADVHVSGPLATLVVASNSVPGLAPPVRYRGELHVDGGVLDNLPVEAARALGAGRVIAVDASSDVHFVSGPDVADEAPSGWALAWDRLRGREGRLPPAFRSLTRAMTLASDRRAAMAHLAADLAVRLDLDGYASSDFQALDALVALGFRQAKERFSDRMEI